ncbi:MAG: hypothetical protein Ct9H300mP1_02160 [Planctomycetaceae bacterium]|nr:MAG: hypothetical protein Ct9H300mP1_02160 [Planctomycetaceae bacterium]
MDARGQQKLIATGFLRNVEDPTTQAQYGVKERYDVLFDVMKTVSSSLLGLTLECARCHSHKYDPIPQRDFYRFMACFEPAMNVHDWKKGPRPVPEHGFECGEDRDRHPQRVGRRSAQGAWRHVLRAPRRLRRRAPVRPIGRSRG